jgi:hypothetical protein
VAVTGALKAGDKVVTDGVDKLRDGARAEIIVPGARESTRTPATRQNPDGKDTRGRRSKPADAVGPAS